MVRNRKDMLVGIMFVGVGLSFLVWSLLTLRLGTNSQMGPGYFPTVLGVALCLLGGAVVFASLRREPVASEAAPTPLAPVPWRSILLVGLSPLAFALTIEPLGLVPASLLTVLVAISASREVTFVRGVAIAIGFTIFCVIVFKYGLGVPFHLAWF